MSKRLVAVMVLCFSSVTWAALVAFWYPDATWARRWLDHPTEMVFGLALALSCCVVAWWPKRKPREDGHDDDLDREVTEWQNLVERRLAERDRSIVDQFGRSSGAATRKVNPDTVRPPPGGTGVQRPRAE